MIVDCYSIFTLYRHVHVSCISSNLKHHRAVMTSSMCENSGDGVANLLPVAGM